MKCRHPGPAALFTVLVAAACGQAESPAPPAPGAGATAFVNARLWDGTGAPVHRDATLLVRDGRVVSVSSQSPPAGAEIVDLDGAFVMPGLVNAHGHVTGRWAPDTVQGGVARIVGDLELLARYGVTTVVSLGGEPPEALVVADGRDDPALDHARLYVAGPVVTAEDPEIARAAAEDNAALGVDWLKLRVDDNLGNTTKMPWDAVQAVIDAGDEAGVPVATHVFYLDDAMRLLDMGTDLIAHSVRDTDTGPAFAERLKQTGVCYVPTLTREISTFVYAERPDFFDDPFFLLHANRDEMARVSEPAFMQAMAESEIAAGYQAAWVQAMANLGRLHEADAPIAMGTDSGPPGRFPGYFEHLELEYMVVAGMTPEAALESATSAAADCMGLDDVGRLEPGRWADFIVLGADPLADITSTRLVDAVYIAGNPVR